MGLLDLLGFSNKTETVKEFIKKGAVIIDVRTTEEYQNGHIKGSKNIPLNMIPTKIDNIKSLNKPIIICCASGMRSAQATSTLKQNGIEAYNGGGWKSLESQL